MQVGSWLLPVILAVLGAAMLVPAVPSFDPHGSARARNTMCSQDTQEPVPSPDVQVPGEHRGRFCRHCSAPFLGTPFALLDAAVSPTPLRAVIAGPQRILAPLRRARETRAPHA
jgi:hypothetical protein